VTRPARLGEAEVAARLRAVPGWSLEGGKLHRAYSFKDFVEAWSFMSAVALVAESMNHHPEWSNVWNRVTVDLITHDAGGLTALDFDLATRMEALAGGRS
jgi:4a-hydroxytetrahydrobiopterin dehydratase